MFTTFQTPSKLRELFMMQSPNTLSPLMIPRQTMFKGHQWDFRKLENNITKATRDLSSRTNANIPNTHRVLMSQIESTPQLLLSEIEANRHKLSLEMAQHHRELMSRMARNSQGPKPQVREYPRLEGFLFGVVLFWVPIVCTMYLQAAFDLVLISTRVQ
ncbi:hypothetical protein B9Z19DRAFT_1119243 [Tuber borchii]|uniref:Uncharacterized protein n=1 Tax=Tuber borchii TaxID=42251 RepID=A0A2T7A6R4_TUBBO|nr:hypothetical protein B9Z19DRAFT_1119243 [Tuber borchii]